MRYSYCYRSRYWWDTVCCIQLAGVFTLVGLSLTAIAAGVGTGALSFALAEKLFIYLKRSVKHQIAHAVKESI